MKKITILAFAVFLSLFVVARSAENNSTLSLTQDKDTGLYILKLRDSQGLKSFSLVYPTDKLPYGGDLAGCQQSKTINNISINAPSDFTPVLNAVVVDCAGNETEFNIAAPVDGVAAVTKVSAVPEPTPAPVSAPSTSSSAGGGAGATDTAVSSGAEDPLASVDYPVKELGSCGSKEACKAYCEKSANIDKCLVFAEKHNLLANKDIERGQKFSKIIKSGGPGGCKSEQECHSYCNDTDKLDECVAFAEANGLMEGQELEEAKKIRGYIKSGKSLPGNCKNRAACEAFCKNPEHMDECIAFAKEAGFMTEKELAEAEKFLPLMKSGQTPGGCRSKEECESFCGNENNFEECFAFAEKAGIISEQERAMMKKTGGKGPGGCRGRACETFCDNPANQKTCFEFGKEHGLISETDMKRMEEGKNMLKKQLESGPPEIRECLKSVIDVSALESDGFMGGPELGEKMRECFEKISPPGAEGRFDPSGEFKGPGGCTSREECEAYCRTNPSECGGMRPPQDIQGEGEPGFTGGVPPQPPSGSFSGPGGCTSREECEAYCREHMEECQKFMPPTSGGFGAPPPSGDIQVAPPNIGAGTMPCPAMPTVNECPQGTAKTKVFSSPECGDYYACTQSGDFQQQFQQQYQMQDNGTVEYQQQFQQEYQKQYEDQYREQYEQQYQQQYQMQTVPSPTPTPPPTSSLPIQSPLALLLWPFLELLK